MFELTEAQKTTKSDLCEELHDTYEAMESAHARLKEAVEQAYQEYQAAEAEYNATLERAVAFAEEIVEANETDNDLTEAQDEWVEMWRDFDYATEELGNLEVEDLPDSAADAFEGLPESL